MSRGLNKVQLIGRLGRDPEMRFTEDGTALTTFRLAVGRQWTDRDGTEHDDTEWFRVVAWERQAETVNEHLSKGDQVYVEGHLRTRTYTDKDGVARTAVEVVANQVLFLGSAQRVREPGADAAPVPPASAAPTVQQAVRRRGTPPPASTPPETHGPARGIELEDLPSRSLAHPRSMPRLGCVTERSPYDHHPDCRRRPCAAHAAAAAVRDRWPHRSHGQGRPAAARPGNDRAARSDHH